MPTTERLAEELEGFVDRHTLGSTLEALETLCLAKADHLDANWQDPGAARVWRRLGGRISGVAEAARKERV
jgi:hypothetical protein